MVKKKAKRKPAKRKGKPAAPRKKPGTTRKRGGVARKGGAKAGVKKRFALPLSTPKKVKADEELLEEYFPGDSIKTEAGYLPPLDEAVELLLPLSLCRAAMIRKLTQLYGSSRSIIDNAIAKAKDRYQQVLQQSREERVSDNMAFLRQNALKAYQAGKYNAAVQAVQLASKLSGDLAPDTMVLTFDVDDKEALKRADALREKAHEAEKRSD